LLKTKVALKYTQDLRKRPVRRYLEVKAKVVP